MDVMVVLLRAVNVSGRGRLAMADLRRVAEGCGFGGVRTYVQSGNLVCTADGAGPAEVARTLEGALAGVMGGEPVAIVRTRDELAAVVDASPFLARGADPQSLHVVFLAGDEPATLGGFDPAPFAPEEVVVIGREVHLHLPDGIGRSKLAAALARRSGGPPATTRNWRTVTTLLAMADDVADRAVR